MGVPLPRSAAGTRVSAPARPARPGDPVTPQHRDALLQGRRGSGLWVFAYGALMWDHVYGSDDDRPCQVPGMVRRYSLWDRRSRGTPSRPALTLGLQPGEGACTGLAVHLPEAGLAENFGKVWEHEMPPGFYNAGWVRADTSAGPVDALTFLANPGSALYAGAKPDAEVAGILSHARGEGGTAADYLTRTAAALRRMGLADPYLDGLEALVSRRS